MAKTKKISITPLRDRVVVKVNAPEVETPSGIIIPDSVSKEKPEQGKVIAVGSGRIENGEQVPMEVKVGDQVLFSKYGPDEVTVNGEEYYIISENNILAIIG